MNLDTPFILIAEKHASFHRHSRPWTEFCPTLMDRFCDAIAESIALRDQNWTDGNAVLRHERDVAKREAESNLLHGENMRTLAEDRLRGVRNERDALQAELALLKKQAEELSKDLAVARAELAVKDGPLPLGMVSEAWIEERRKLAEKLVGSEFVARGFEQAAKGNAEDKKRLDALQENPSDLSWNGDELRWDFSWSAGRGHNYGYSHPDVRVAIDAIITSADSDRARSAASDNGKGE